VVHVENDFLGKEIAFVIAIAALTFDIHHAVAPVDFQHSFLSTSAESWRYARRRLVSQHLISTRTSGLSR
jgi:hypothetical protein